MKMTPSSMSISISTSELRRDFFCWGVNRAFIAERIGLKTSCKTSR
jgi:hypothetical protein